MSALKREAERFGRLAEWIACLLLLVKGYRILGRRVRTPVGEIDILARRGPWLVFVEVKARRSLDAARAALSPVGIARLRRAALWAGKRHASPSRDIRFDAIMIAPGRFPRHLRHISTGGLL